MTSNIVVKNQIFEMDSSIEIENIENYFEIKFAEENKNILKTLTYRQIIILFSKVDSKTIEFNV